MARTGYESSQLLTEQPLILCLPARFPMHQSPLAPQGMHDVERLRLDAEPPVAGARADRQCDLDKALGKGGFRRFAVARQMRERQRGRSEQLAFIRRRVLILEAQDD